jgi:NitT/TauT family transport system substrate-binding protein
MGKIGVRSFMAGLIGLALVTGSGVAQAAEDKLSMRLDWQLTGYQVPFYWAKAKGYYKDGNLDVDIKSGSGSGLTINLVGSQQDDLGFADYLLMATAVAKGMNVKAIYGVVQDGAWAVISHADKPIRVPADLKGMSIATTADHKALLDLFIKLNKIPEEQVTIRVVNAATRNTVFDQGQVDGLFSITIGSPMDLLVRAQQGKSKPLHIMPFADFGLAPQGQGIIVSEATLGAKRDAVRRFVTATDKAFVEAGKPENIEEAIKISVRDSGASDERAASVQLQWQDTLKHLRTKNTKDKPLGWMSEADWLSSLEILQKTDRLSTPLEATSIFTNDFIPSAK